MNPMKMRSQHAVPFIQYVTTTKHPFLRVEEQTTQYDFGILLNHTVPALFYNSHKVIPMPIRYAIHPLCIPLHLVHQVKYSPLPLEMDPYPYLHSKTKECIFYVESIMRMMLLLHVCISQPLHTIVPILLINSTLRQMIDSSYLQAMMEIFSYGTLEHILLEKKPQIHPPFFVDVLLLVVLLLPQPHLLKPILHRTLHLSWPIYTFPWTWILVSSLVYHMVINPIGWNPVKLPNLSCLHHSLLLIHPMI
mmetsp:Transcript_8039/g.11491  ORF Transcript_8039/g.11491 Transcript_8039/m.11491 type:complete len:249 (-) Transcript_8039:87-833(-)